MTRPDYYQAESESGDVVLDPSEDALYMLASELALPDNSFLTIEHPGTVDEWYVVIARQPGDKWEVEYRHVRRGIHEVEVTNDLSRLCTDVTTWLFCTGRSTQ